MLGFSARTLALAPIKRWDPDRVAKIAEQRVRKLVRRAVRQTAFYREKYRGIDLDRCRLADLPPTNKGELMARFDDAIADPEVRRADLERFVDDPANEGRLFLDRYIPSHTSGSQGQPMLMLQTSRTLELLFGIQMTRGNPGKVSVAEAVRRIVRPNRLAIVTLKRGFYPSASTFEYMPAAPKHYLKVLRLSQTDDDLIDRLNGFRPTSLTAYAGVLEMLAPEARSGRLKLSPTLYQVVNNSEVLTEHARERIEAAFGVRVMDNYATGECPFLTSGCPTDPGAHVNADWACLEVVDDDYRPVPPGTPGRKVLITNLANHLQPFIRYEVGDVLTMADEPCGCGSRLPRVARIEGRSADTFWVADGSRYRQMINSVFKNAFDYTREVREWQAVQYARNRVRVSLELLPGATFDRPRARAALDRQLALYGFADLVDVSLEVVPRLEADSNSGKFRRMVSHVGPPGPEPATVPLVRPSSPASSVFPSKSARLA